MKKVWIFNHYATNMFTDHAGRHYSIAKHLINEGFDVRIFCASTIHNSNINLINDNRTFYNDICDGIPVTFVKTRSYVGNGKARILNMLDFYRNMFSVTKQFEKPDVIIGSSVHPLTCVGAIKLSKRYGCRNIVEIRDLWPESIVEYGIKSRKSFLIKQLYNLEKWIYKKADAVVFTMEGGKDYIKKQGWDIDLQKVYHINNGVELELFRRNSSNTIKDADLDNPNLFKVVYTGSIRRANNIDLVLDAAKLVQNPKIRFILWGDGDQTDRLKQRVIDENISNVIFKSKVEKQSVPGIVSRAYVNFFVLENSPLFRYGISLNKSFEYLAAAKPMIIVGDAAYSIVDEYACGIHIHETSAQLFANAVDELSVTDKEQYDLMCNNAKEAVKHYDFKALTQKLIQIINSI